ncbi:MAG: biotin--[acetyl-CoA-carboxylase] ligase, partial [Caldimonas sp.]
MAGTGLPWNVEGLQRRLGALCPGIGIEIVAEAGSTNTDLLDRIRASAAPADTPSRVEHEAAASAGAMLRRSVESAAFTGRERPVFAPCLRVAEQQTRGRGRQGRAWASALGASLTFSLALPLARADWSGLSLVVGVALAEALDGMVTDASRPAQGARQLGLKWPNDLWLMKGPGSGRKLGGVLIETVPLGMRRIAVIGVGINVGALGPDADAPSDLAWLNELAPDATVPSTLDAIASPLLEAVQLFDRSGFAAFRERYAARDVLVGLPVRTTQADATEGIARGVTAQGALVVRTQDGMLRNVSSGEVSVRLGASDP